MLIKEVKLKDSVISIKNEEEDTKEMLKEIIEAI